MSRRWGVPPLALVALLACSKPAAEPPRPRGPANPAQSPDVAAEKKNLLNMAYGATVISRTAELTLQNSAALAIDGNAETGWISPPYDTLQSFVLALPARTRIEQVGLQTSPSSSLEVRRALFEGSADGRTFTKIYEARFEPQQQVQLVAVDPVEAKYIRMTTLEAPGRFARINGVHVRGTRLTTPVRGSIEGCWSINGFEARFGEENGRVSGSIEEHGVVTLDGGADGMVYRLAWMRGPERGLAAITVSEDGQHLTGLHWYIEPWLKNFGGSWLGERKPCGESALGPRPSALGDRGASLPETATTFLTRAASFPLYSRSPETVLHVLAQLPSQHLRIVSHEYREDSAEANRRRAQMELDAIREALQKRGADLSRIDFVVSGSNRRRKEMNAELIRALYSAVEIERR